MIYTQSQIDAFVLRMLPYYNDEQIIGAIMLRFKQFYDEAEILFNEAKKSLKTD